MKTLGEHCRNKNDGTEGGEDPADGDGFRILNDHPYERATRIHEGKGRSVIHR